MLKLNNKFEGNLIFEGLAEGDDIDLMVERINVWQKNY